MIIKQEKVVSGDGTRNLRSLPIEIGRASGQEDTGSADRQWRRVGFEPRV